MFGRKKEIMIQAREIENLKISIENKNREIENLKEKNEKQEKVLQEYLEEIKRLKQVATNDCIAVYDIRQELTIKKSELERRKFELGLIEVEIEESRINLEKIKSELIRESDLLELQSFGFYEPLMKNVTTEELNNQLEQVRYERKLMLKTENFYRCETDWHVNNSYNKGKTMIKRQAKNYITAFNMLCSSIGSQISVHNIQKKKEYIENAFTKMNQQCQIFSIIFEQRYLENVLLEIDILYSEVLLKEEEKEKKRIEREKIKEQKKLEKELKEEREKIEKELKHYENNYVPGDEVILSKIKELKDRLAKNDYRKMHELAGYVYIIENKSFKRNVYKIGVTRRLDPNVRIAELSNASVPFRYKPNCFIFSENAYQLEFDLHKEFEPYRINKANKRKEFFEIPLEKIQNVLKEKYNINEMFDYEPENEEWLISNYEPEGIDDEDDED